MAQVNADAFLHRLYFDKAGLHARRSTHAQRQRRAWDMLGLSRELVEPLVAAKFDLYEHVMDLTPVATLMAAHGFRLTRDDIYVNDNTQVVFKHSYFKRAVPPLRAVPTYFVAAHRNADTKDGMYLVFQAQARLAPQEWRAAFGSSRFHNVREFGGDPHGGNVGIYKEEFVVFDW